MKQSLTTWLFFLVTAITAQAQSPFQRTYGWDEDDAAYACIKTTDGNYLIAGNGSDSIFYRGMYLVKIDTSGNPLLEKIFYPLSCGKIKNTPGGGYILCGYAGNGMNNNSNLVLVKTDSLLDTLWTKSFSGPGPAYYTAFAHDVIATSDGGYAIAGSEASGNNTNFYLVKTDGNGNRQWSRSYGGSLTDEAYSLQQTPDGGFVLGGITYGLGQGTYEVYIVRTDATGNIVWTKTYGGTRIESAYHIENTFDGGFVVTGKTSGYGTGQIYDDDLFLMKLDSSGNSEWSYVYGQNENEEGRSVKQTSDNGFIVTGYSKSFGAGATDAYLLKTDSVGGVEWSKVYGGASDDKANDVLVDGSSFLIAGETRNFSHGLNDYYLVCTDAAGNSTCRSDTALTIRSTLPWTQGSGGSDSAVGTIKSNQFNIYSPVPPSHDPCSCIAPVANFYASWTDGCAAFYDFSTWADSWYWDLGIDTSTSQNPFACYSTGYYTVCLTVTNSCGTDSHCDSFLVEVGIKESMARQNNFFAYPNPSWGPVTFNYLAAGNHEYEIDIYNIAGQLERKYFPEPGKEIFELPAGALTAGIYLAELKEDDGRKSFLKLVILR